MKLRYAAKILVRRKTDGKYLMLWGSEWEERPDRSQKPDLPGGIVEESESMTEGLLREMREEVGFDVDESQLTLAYAHMYDRDDFSAIFLVYFAEVDEDPAVTLSWEHERYDWLSAEEVLALEIRVPYPTILEHMHKTELLV